MSDSFETPWTVARQTPLSMRFPRQEYGGGLPFFSWGSSRPRDQTWVSYTDRQILYNWDPREAAATQAWGSTFRGSTAQSTPWFRTFSLQSVQKYNSVVLGHPFVVLCYSIYYFVTSSPRVLTQAVSKESSFCPNTRYPQGKLILY